MTEQKNDTASSEDAAQKQIRFAVQLIYIKDMSFQAPGSGEQFRDGFDPEVKLELKADTQKLPDDLYEVTLRISVTASHKETKATIYQVEVNQAGLFLIRNLPEQDFMHALNASCPGILFPYARQAISGIVERAGFPQLLLTPMNFSALHQAYLSRQKQTAAASAEPVQ